MWRVYVCVCVCARARTPIFARLLLIWLDEIGIRKAYTVHLPQAQDVMLILSVQVGKNRSS